MDEVKPAARRFERYVAIGDSSTEGLDDPDGSGGWRGWADRLADRLAALQGGILYANFAVRGKRSREILAEQLEAARALGPDLATVFAGSNDILDRGFDAAALREDLVRMQSGLRECGAVVLGFTLPELGKVMPFGGLLRGRIRAMNDALRSASEATGSRLVDFAAHGVASDRRLWSADRFHVNAEGHARIAAALAQALGLPGTDDAWSRPLPAEGAPGPLSRLAADLGWILGRFLPSRGVGGPRGPKRPRLERVDPPGLTSGTRVRCRNVPPPP